MADIETFFEMDQALKSVALLKEALKEADWGKIRYSASDKEKCLSYIDEAMEFLEKEIQDEDDGSWMSYDPILFKPEDMICIMKDTLVGLAKKMSGKNFHCEIESSSTYDNGNIEATYDGNKLEYKTRYWTCDYDEEPDYRDTVEEIII